MILAVVVLIFGKGLALGEPITAVIAVVAVVVLALPAAVTITVVVVAVAVPAAEFIVRNPLVLRERLALGKLSAGRLKVRVCRQ